MIIAFPNDNRGFLYHHIDLLGQTVHAYRDFDRAVIAREGDQRVFIQREATGEWLTGPPTLDLETVALRINLGTKLPAVNAELDAAAKNLLALNVSGATKDTPKNQKEMDAMLAQIAKTDKLFKKQVWKSTHRPCPHCGRVYDEPLPSTPGCFSDDCPGHDLAAPSSDSTVLVAGNLIDGFEFYGPFSLHEDAATYAEKYLKGADWWTAPMSDPTQEGVTP